MTTVEVCGVIAAMCMCGLTAGHDGPHECDLDNCDGQWLGEMTDEGATEDFDPVRYPSGGF